ncbi:MAG: hypothetical protein Kow0069_23340 [Promethearchaeota archaeon]
MTDVCEKLKQGARFACQMCGFCCSTKDGHIFVFPEEIPPIVKYLGLKPSEFFENYVGVVRDRYVGHWMHVAVILQEKDGRCTFFGKDKKCKIYPVRPFQCRGFPFWRMYVEDCDGWDEVSSLCPGIGKGNKVSKRKIVALVKREVDLEVDYYKRMKKRGFDVKAIYPLIPSKLLGEKKN